MGFYWLWNSFLGRDIAYISSCSRTGGVPVGLYGFFKFLRFQELVVRTSCS